MKITVIGSHICPDTLFTLNRLAQAGVEIDFKEIRSGHSELKEYLKLRDGSDLYRDIRNTERLGIPCFVKEDGTATLDIEEIIGK